MARREVTIEDIKNWLGVPPEQVLRNRNRRAVRFWGGDADNSGEDHDGAMDSGTDYDGQMDSGENDWGDVDSGESDWGAVDSGDSDWGAVDSSEHEQHPYGPSSEPTDGTTIPGNISLQQLQSMINQAILENAAGKGETEDVPPPSLAPNLEVYNQTSEMQDYFTAMQQAGSTAQEQFSDLQQGWEDFQNFYQQAGQDLTTDFSSLVDDIGTFREGIPGMYDPWQQRAGALDQEMADTYRGIADDYTAGMNRVLSAPVSLKMPGGANVPLAPKNWSNLTAQYATTRGGLADSQFANRNNLLNSMRSAIGEQIAGTGGMFGQQAGALGGIGDALRGAAAAGQIGLSGQGAGALNQFNVANTGAMAGLTPLDMANQLLHAQLGHKIDQARIDAMDQDGGSIADALFAGGLGTLASTGVEEAIKYLTGG